MEQITKLTNEQKAMLLIWRDRWIAIALSTEPADRPRAEAAYRACYRYANLRDDVPIVWVSSPLVGALAASIALGILSKESDFPAVDSAVQSAVHSAVHSVVHSAVNTAVNTAVSSVVHSAVYSAVQSAVASAVHSAVQSAVNTAVHSAINTAVQSAVNTAVASAVASAAHSAVHSAINTAVASAVQSAVQSAVNTAINTAVHSAVNTVVYSAVQSAVDSAVNTASNFRWSYWLGGALWPAWPAYESFFRDCCGLKLKQGLSDVARAYAATAETAGYWWPASHFILACDRPAEINRDDQGRLHSTTGPAIAWRDGWAIHSWHGVTVPREWIEAPESLTAPAALGEENTERRRAACEILGWQKVLDEIGARVIDRDADSEIGELLAADLPDAPGSRFLRVRCGTGRQFVLPVPPTVQTALEANAWTYDIPNNLLATKEFRT